ncbi:MAG: hypothetical protein RLZZ210_619 [Pseudomonadota bacterium]|jgi:type IV secretory pathway TrbF-like protein
MLNTIKKLFAKNKNTEINYQSEETEDINPFLKSKMHLDFQIEKLVINNKNLIIQRNILGVLLLASILGLIYLGSQSKTEAIITMVDEKGQRIQPINLREMKDEDQRNRIITKTIEESLINLRTVTPDKILQLELIKKALVNVRKDSQAYKVISDAVKETNEGSPYNVGKQYMITPVIKSVSMQDTIFNGENVKRASLVIEWRERVNRLDGTYQQTNEYKGNFIFDITSPQTEEEIRQNPFGIQIYNLQVVPIRIVDKVNDNQPLHSN